MIRLTLSTVSPLSLAISSSDGLLFPFSCSAFTASSILYRTRRPAYFSVKSPSPSVTVASLLLTSDKRYVVNRALSGLNDSSASKNTASASCESSSNISSVAAYFATMERTRFPYRTCASSRNLFPSSISLSYAAMLASFPIP